MLFWSLAAIIGLAAGWMGDVKGPNVEVRPYTPVLSSLTTNNSLAGQGRGVSDAVICDVLNEFLI